jgi:hypothetical protein
MTDERAQALWREYAKARELTDDLRYRLFSEQRGRVPEVIRRALKNPRERLYSLEIVAMLPLEERKELLPDLLAVAAYAGAHMVRAQELILSFPKDWLLINIDAAASPILEQGDAEEFRRILELYSQIESTLLARLVERASSHPDPDVRAAAEDFMSSK